MKQNERTAKIEAAYRLLKEETTTWQKFEEIRTLIKGLDPRIDKSLFRCSEAVRTLKQVQKGEIIDLSQKAIKALPGKSERQKRRKKALLLLLKSWKQLRSEVKRIKTVYKSQVKGKTTSQETTKTIGRIITTAKGPLGIITIAAVGIVGIGAILSNIAVDIVIKNQGCDPLNPIVKLPFPIPGLKLPNNVIADGKQSVATLPPINFSINNRDRESIKLTTFNLTMNFKLNNKGIDLIFDKGSILGRETTINLSNKKKHELIIACR